MNERIRELAEQVVGPSRLHGGEFALFGDEQVEQFARLIVQECIDHAFNNGTDIEYMANHFGIEEPKTKNDGNEEFRDGRDMPWAAVRWGRG